MVTKAAVSAVPFAGGPLTELMDLLQAPLQKRQHEWWTDLAERVAALEAEGRLSREGLAENESFFDAAARAVSAAVRTGQREKREALRNAVLSIALGTSPDEAEQEIFLGLIERFTIWHLRLLKAFEHPLRWAQEHDVKYNPAMFSGLDHFIEEAFPELRGRSGFYDAVWSGLWQERLVNTDGLHANMSQAGWQASRVSELGVRFLRFIEES